MAEDHQLARLIRYIRHDRDDKRVKSQSRLAKEIGVSQKTIWRWEQSKGGVDRNARDKLAIFLRKATGDLDRYLTSSEEPSVFLGEQYDTVRYLRLDQIIEWLYTLRPDEVLEVVKEGFQILTGHFNVPDPSIADLVRDNTPKALTEMSGEQVSKISEGGYPEDEELQTLASLLGRRWTVQRLTGIRSRDFGDRTN